MTEKLKVAFICVHNSCRSQMAEALAKKYASDVFEIYSAGSTEVDKINEDAVKIMKDLYNVDMTIDQYPKLISELPQVDIVVTMGCNVVCPNIESLHREDWGLDDPSNQGYEAFKFTVDRIEEKVLDLKKRYQLL